MAHISGIKPGLVPVETESSIEHKMRAAIIAAAAPAPSEVVCEVCGGQVGFITSRNKLTNPCRHCRDFFGIETMFGGVTSDDAEGAAAKLAKIRDAGWLMVLKAGTYGVPGGGTVTVEPGDVFSIANGWAGNADLMATKTACSKDRTWAMFTAGIKIGPHTLTLFTHEISAMPWLTIMELKAAGELVEQYVSNKDDQGHFAPSPALREQIYNTFGAITGRPR